MVGSYAECVAAAVFDAALGRDGSVGLFVGVSVDVDVFVVEADESVAVAGCAGPDVADAECVVAGEWSVLLDAVPEAGFNVSPLSYAPRFSVAFVFAFTLVVAVAVAPSVWGAGAFGNAARHSL